MPKCKQCKDKFEVKYFNQKFCMENDTCIKAFTDTLKNIKAKEWRKQKKVRRDALKTTQDYIKELQIVFNKYIRLRDKDLTCISCQRNHTGQYHAGHYRSVGGNPELRFEELNNNKQCAPCNNHLSGNLINYRINLIKKIGLKKVEWLEGNHEPKHYTIEQLKGLKTLYKLKIKNVE